jgi:hypothetical protein
MQFKKSSKSKRPIIIHNDKKFFGFKISKIPNRFGSIEHSEPIKNWFNLAGFTFIEESNFIDLFGNITIE